LVRLVEVEGDAGVVLRGVAVLWWHVSVLS
jgi:hypothetical protein